MFDKSKIVTDVYKIVGLRQPFNTSYDILDADNITSRSGYYSNDNPMAKVEFLYDCQDTKNISASNFNALVKRMQCSAINEVCNEVFSEADYIDKNLLFIYPQNKVEVETLPSGFVGYKIEIGSEKNVALEITRCLFSFSGTGTLKLLLFSSAENTPLQSKTITITNGQHEESLKWVLDNSSKSYKAKYYLGYLSNSVTGTLAPYKRNYENSSLMSSFSYIDIKSIYVAGKTTETMWDLTTEQGGTSDYYGLNPDINVFYDYTDLILRNEKLFAKAIDLAFQIKIIQSYIATSRSNRNERIAEDLIVRAMAEVEGVPEGTNLISKIGLRSILIGEIRMIRSEILKLKNGYFNNGINVITLE